jgi:hypothetical protein
MPRYQLGSRLLWLQGILLSVFFAVQSWQGFAMTWVEKTLWSVVLVGVFGVLWGSPFGYANQEGIRFRKLLRVRTFRWEQLEEAEWIAEDQTLHLKFRYESVFFRFREIAGLLGNRPRPEAVNFIQQKMNDLGLGQRFVCKTSLLNEAWNTQPRR